MNQEQDQEQKQGKKGFPARLAEDFSAFLASVIAAVSAGWSLLIEFVKWVVLLPFRFIGWVVSGLAGLLESLAPLIAAAFFIWWFFFSDARKVSMDDQSAQEDKGSIEVEPHTAFAFLARSYAQGERRIEFELASFAAEAGKEAAVKKAFTKIIEKQPDAPLGYYRFAMFLKKQGELDEALKKLNQAISKAQRSNADTARLISEFRIKTGRYKMPAGFTELLKDLGVSQMPEPLVAKALELPLLPAVDEMRAERAWLLFRLGQTARSKNIFRDLAKEDPDNPRYRGALGYQLAYEGNDLEKARRLLEEAAKEAPNDPNILTALGWAQYRQGLLRDASVNLAKALRSNQEQDQYDYIRTLAHYGEVIWEEGYQEEAIKIWREAWCEDNEHDVLQRTLWRYNKGFEEGDPRHRQTARGAVLCRASARLKEN